MLRPHRADRRVTVERDGSVHSAAEPPNALGVVTPEKLAALEAAIKATDFVVLKSSPVHR